MPPTGEAEGQPPSADELMRHYFALLNEIGIIAQLSRATFEAANAGEVTLPQFTVLNHLVRRGDGPSPLDLASAFQVPRASMTNTLQGLERQGLIETRPNPRDGRSKRVCLTPAGRAMRERCIDRLAPSIAALSSSFRPTRSRGSCRH
jgi:DNA-binding MarR family transcriptional regulator